MLQNFTHEYGKKGKGHYHICIRNVHATSHRGHNALDNKENFIVGGNVFVFIDSGQIHAIG